ncbi:hypothetical protein ACN47E_009872 [Coniothyrium glycines]
MHKTPSQDEIASTLAHLELSPTAPQKPAQKPKSKPVADSWDDDDASPSSASGSDTETDDAAAPVSAHTSASPRDDALEPISTVPSHDASPHPPPPTPASPTPFDFLDAKYGALDGEARGRGAAGSVPDKRPEKTTAVAGRMIAGALGVRAPKRTDEEREFDRAVREKEKKRRAEEKERERKEAVEREARKKAVWDD